MGGECRAEGKEDGGAKKDMRMFEEITSWRATPPKWAPDVLRRRGNLQMHFGSIGQCHGGVYACLDVFNGVLLVV